MLSEMIIEKVLDLTINGGLSIAGSYIEEKSKTAISVPKNIANAMESLGIMTNNSLIFSDRLTKLAETTAEKSGFSKIKTSETISSMADSGFGFENIEDSLLPILKFAEKNDIDPVSGANIASELLKDFNLAGDEAERVLNAFQSTVIDTSATFNDVLNNMDTYGRSLRNLGISVEATSELFKLLFNSDIEKDDVGGEAVSLVKRLNDLSKNENAMSILAKKGIEYSDLDPKNNTPTSIIKKITYAGLNKDEAQEILGDNGPSIINSMIEKLKDNNRKQYAKMFIEKNQYSPKPGGGFYAAKENIDETIKKDLEANKKTRIYSNINHYEGIEAKKLKMPPENFRIDLKKISAKELAEFMRLYPSEIPEGEFLIQLDSNNIFKEKDNEDFVSEDSKIKDKIIESVKKEEPVINKDEILHNKEETTGDSLNLGENSFQEKAKEQADNAIQAVQSNFFNVIKTKFTESQSLYKEFSSGLTSNLTESLMTGENKFDDFFKSILRKFLEFEIQKRIISPLFSKMGIDMGGSDEGQSINLGGGQQSSINANVPAAALQTGSNGAVINIINNTSSQVSASERSEGGTSVYDITIENVKRGMSNGVLDSSFKAAYGLNRVM